MKLPENILDLSLKGFGKAIIWHSEGIYFCDIDKLTSDVKSWLDALKDELHGHKVIIERIRIFSGDDEIHIWRKTDDQMTFRQWSANSTKEYILKDEHQLVSGSSFAKAGTEHFLLTEDRGIEFRIPVSWIGNTTDFNKLNNSGNRLKLAMQSAYIFHKEMGYTLLDYRYISISLIEPE